MRVYVYRRKGKRKKGKEKEERETENEWGQKGNEIGTITEGYGKKNMVGKE